MPLMRKLVRGDVQEEGLYLPIDFTGNVGEVVGEGRLAVWME